MDEPAESSSLTEDSRALEVDAVGDGCREDEQQITQVGYLCEIVVPFLLNLSTQQLVVLAPPNNQILSIH
jgi:hypothetical protein